MGEILDSSMQRKQTAVMLRQDCVAGLVKPGPVGTCSNPSHCVNVFKS